MKSFLEDFKELSVDELLSVNGGYSSYSGYSGYCSGSCGIGKGGEDQTDEKDLDRVNKHGNYGFNENETESYNMKKVGLGWSSTEKEYTDDFKEEDHNRERQKFLGRVSSLSRNGSGEEKFVDSLLDHQYDKYQTQETKDYDVYMCDDFVQKVLTDADINYNDYFAGSAASTNCDTHIKKKALAKGSGYTEHVPTEKGIYVVLMNDSAKGFIAHTAFYVVDDEGSYAIDNSSGNYGFKDGNDDRRKGGVEETICNSSGLSCKFGYNKFYYKQIEF